MITQQKNNNEMAGVYLIYRNTCHFENKDTYGVSHILEHMICNSLESKENEYMSFAIVSNAFTSKDFVCFHMTGLHDILKKTAKEYFDLVSNYVPSEEHFEKEIGIICQEYEDSFASPSFNAFSNLSSKKFGDIFPIGIRPVLEKISFEEVVDFYDKYFKLNQAIIINKDNDTYGITGDGCFSRVIEPSLHNEFFYSEKCEVNDLSQDMFLISDKMIPFDNKSYILPFISKMLSEGLSSPLYKQVREEKHLVYAINSEAAYYKLLGQNFIVNTTASIDKVNDIKNEILYVLNNPEKFLTQKYFNEIKENTRIRKIIREQNKTSINSVSINFLEDKRISFQDKLDIINYDEVMNYYDMYVHPKNVNYEFLTHRQINS